MVTQKAPKGHIQLPLLPPESDWRPPALSSLPSWKGARRISFDCETRDPFIQDLGPGYGRPNSYMIGYSFAIDGGPAFYVPLRHQGGDNVDDPIQALNYLRDNAAEFDGELVGMQLDYDLGWALTEQVEFKRAKCRDIQIADALIYELHHRYSMKEIGKRWDIDAKDETQLEEAAKEYGVDPKSGMWRLPARYVGRYGTKDAVAPLQIYAKQEKEIERQGLGKVWDLESDVQPVLVKMRHRGVRVSMDRLRKVEQWSLDEEIRQFEIIRRDTGITVDSEAVRSAEALVPVFKSIGYEVATSATGKLSVTKELLASIDHPVAGAVRRARQMWKLRNDFAGSVRSHLINGRIHCTFNQTAREDEEAGGIKGARYGRLSCEHVNLQQQPSRDDFAPMWRAIYLPEEGTEWCSADYSQQEPRWLHHFAEIARCTGAAEAAQRYRDDPLTDNHQMMADLTGLPRKYAKNIYLGLCYGEGGAKLAHDLGLSTKWAVVHTGENGRAKWSHYATQDEAAKFAHTVRGRYFEVAGDEAKAVLDQFRERAPYVKELAELCEETASKRGYIITADGRHCRFPMLNGGTWHPNSGPYDWAHKALNRLIQGSSAGQTKRALVEVDRAGFYLQLQVHDELASSVTSRMDGERIGEIMRNVMPANVPFRVDLEYGPSWGEAAA